MNDEEEEDELKESIISMGMLRNPGLIGAMLILSVIVSCVLTMWISNSFH